MKDLNTLRLEQRHRPGGGGSTARSYIDFIVDGRSLLDTLGPNAGDTCGCLGWGDPQWQARTIRRLCLEEDLLVTGEREPLYVCPECGDLGCGAVTARITMSRGAVHWSDFAFESLLDRDLQVFADVGPFAFELGAYRRTLALYNRAT